MFYVRVNSVRQPETFESVYLARAFADMHRSSVVEIWGPRDGATGHTPWERRDPEGSWIDSQPFFDRE